MNIEEAKDIAHAWCRSQQKITAIKCLREHAVMGLKEAKDYLDEHGRHENDLIRKLTEDFVKDPKELLIEARAELRRQLAYIESLVLACGDEEVPQALLDQITAPQKVTLGDLVVTAVRVNGVSLFPEDIPAEVHAGDFVVVTLEPLPLDGWIGTIKVVPTPEWDAGHALYDGFTVIKDLPVGDHRQVPDLIRDFE